MNKLLFALAVGASALPVAAHAQTGPTINQSIAGTRLDISASGEAVRVPDIATITAGVVTRSATPAGAVRENAARMERVITALRTAGIAERDIQTSSVNLNPEHRYDNNQPKLIGYQASNQITIRFRDIGNSGRVLDTLVAEGANQINGPTFSLEKPLEAMDEARAQALSTGRARAENYARALGKRVTRVVFVSESGGFYPPPPPPPAMESDGGARISKTAIVPGEQRLQVMLSMVFELQ